MNYIKQLTHFFNMSAQDKDISPTHISLFMALFQHWNQYRFNSQIQIIRDDIMKMAKINSKATYHKAMAYLHQHRYINYNPSFNPYKGSMIQFFPNGKSTDVIKPITSQYEPVHILTTRPINEPNNKLNSNTIMKHNSITSHAIESQLKNEPLKKEKSCGKKEIPPLVHEVEEYFIQMKSSPAEAQKFINHYTANGWLVGGKTPMKDWEASARNWISNSSNFTPRNYGNHNSTNNQANRSKHLHTKTDKNYFEPL